MKHLELVLTARVRNQYSYLLVLIMIINTGDNQILMQRWAEVTSLKSRISSPKSRPTGPQSTQVSPKSGRRKSFQLKKSK